MASTARARLGGEEPHDDEHEEAAHARALKNLNSNWRLQAAGVPVRAEAGRHYARLRTPFPAPVSRSNRSLMTSLPTFLWPTVM